MHKQIMKMRKVISVFFLLFAPMMLPSCAPVEQSSNAAFSGRWTMDVTRSIPEWSRKTYVWGRLNISENANQIVVTSRGASKDADDQYNSGLKQLLNAGKDSPHNPTPPEIETFDFSGAETRGADSETLKVLNRANGTFSLERKATLDTYTETWTLSANGRELSVIRKSTDPKESWSKVYFKRTEERYYTRDPE